MSDAKTFKCPSCGSALEPDGDEKEIKCAYCGNTVIVPEELLDQDTDQDADDELAPGEDAGSPRHIQWLIQHGADATVKVDRIKDGYDLNVSGKKADGGNFKGHAWFKVPPLPALPQPGTILKIKYRPYDDTDFIIQIDGQFYGQWWMKNSTIAHAADTTTAVQQIDVQPAEKQFEAEPEQKRIDDAEKKQTKGGKALRVTGGIIAVVGILLLLRLIIGWGVGGGDTATEDYIITIIVCPTPLIVLGAGLFVWGVSIRRKLKEVSS